MIWGLGIAAATLWPATAWAAAEGPIGAAPAPLWGLPFAGLLLTIAFLPMLAPRLWHRRMGLIAASWSLALLLPLLVLHGPAVAWHDVWHAILLDYLPFVSLLLALFTAGGGILLEGGPWGTPAGNTALLALGTVLAGVMGTTGVAMVLIHPLLRANAHRTRKVHLVVFFIVLAANVGGATTPLGDPPLYLGFLQGVPFFWPLQNLTVPLLVVAGPLLASFWLLDLHLARSDPPPPPARRLRVRGWRNAALVLLVVATVLLQGVWHPGELVLLGQPIGLERLLGMLVFGGITAASLVITPHAVRQRNLFTWAPMMEVAVLFAAIFVTIGPVLAMLAAGPAGPLAPLLALTSDAAGRPSPLAYFWLAGLLSGFLDNAPTYLVFFNMAGGDPAALTGHLAPVLRALSSGAVFFGALTYVGNAPNMMVRAIAAHRGVRMPGFFAYILYAGALLMPLFGVLTLIYARP